ncbi:MAG: protein kinase domain-containing protein [Candidatus Eiseniibacteriota bacterium]
MSLMTGTRLGQYEILAPLGAGGMGEVYRARDTRLERTVAIKSLPKAFTSDPERRARFEREAKLVAALNHPNIAMIHGLEDVDGTPYIVLEFVDGETLSARLARGPLSVRETLDLGGQIAAAVDAAHERGIVHRDLKPANVILTPSGAVKVLDFGLAKGTEPGSSSDLTVTPQAPSITEHGVVLGTAPYMSPEQARGKPVDRRTDVWAFGCLLFECLSGKQTFAGETSSDVIAGILEREPDWSALPPGVPVRLRELMERCLTKDATERPRDIGDLRRELSAIAAELSSAGRGPASGIGPKAAELPSLAVLYFENLAADKESDYFCSGITEDILTDLSKIKGLRVASRNAVARYRGQAVDIAKVGTELGVRAVLEGSVRRAGDRVRITAQLINAADGFHLWADRYDRTLEDVFAVQEEIASSIAEALRVALRPGESENLGKERPKDVRAYDLYLKGRDRYRQYSEKSIREAFEFFREATEIDPNYALAWSGIADCYGQMLQFQLTDDPVEARRSGIEAARRAIAIDPRLAEGHKALALVLRQSGEAAESRMELERALEVNPRFTPAMLNLAVNKYALADVAGTERLIRRVLEIDPQELFAVTWLSVLLLDTERIEESIATARRLREMTDATFYINGSYGLRIAAHILRGDYARAEQTLEEALKDGADGHEMDASRAAIAAGTGRHDEARRLVEELKDPRGLNTGSCYLLAEACVRLGDLDRALVYLRQPVNADLSPVSARLNPNLHPVLDREPYAPRRSNLTLVWPLEAPMVSAVNHALFKEVRIDTGRAAGSDARLA